MEKLKLVLKTCCYLGGFVSFVVSAVVAYQELPKRLFKEPTVAPKLITSGPCDYGQIEDMKSSSCSYPNVSIDTQEVSDAVLTKTSEIVDDLKAKRLKEAKQKLESLVLQGHPLALSLLGNIYEYGQFFGKNLSKATEVFEVAISSGSSKAKRIYANFLIRNFSKDQRKMKRAETLLREASQEGDADALEQLAKMLLVQDPQRALPFMIKAAEADMPESQRALGLAYIEGDFLPKDNERGFKWLERAALNNDPAAMMSVATCYLDGIGTEKDIKTGLTWAWISASLKEPKAALVVGYGVYHGVYGIKDEINGMMWLKVAGEHLADKQHPEFIKDYKRILRESPDWLNKATAKMALKCFKEGQCGQPGWNTKNLDTNTSI